MPFVILCSYKLFSIFHRIVKKINNSSGQDSRSKSIIGGLDITGFESFDHNRFVEISISKTMCNLLVILTDFLII